MSSSSQPPTKPPNKPSPTANTKPGRLPAPTLFVGPPSRNTSQLSVSRQLLSDATPGKSTRDPLNRQRSALSRAFEPAESRPEAGPEWDKNKDASGSGRGQARLRKDSERSTEARWKELQSTLDEVEMTAQSSTHVFGESHARALDGLRDAQVALAYAWGRGNEESGALGQERGEGEGDAVSQFSVGGEQGKREGGGGAAAATTAAAGESGRRRSRADTQASASTVLSDESGRSDETTKESRAAMEDETAEDIRRASERRGKNEEYFRMVEKSVNDVVGKLDAVAEAMRGVEAESRGLWSGSGSSGSASGSGSEQGGREGASASYSAVAVK